MYMYMYINSCPNSRAAHSRAGGQSFSGEHASRHSLCAKKRMKLSADYKIAKHMYSVIIIIIYKHVHDYTVPLIRTAMALHNDCVRSTACTLARGKNVQHTYTYIYIYINDAE